MKLLKHLMFLLATGLAISSSANAQMKAHFINVGQAESILLEFKTAAVLIDAGGENTGNTRDRDRLIGYLNGFFNGRPELGRTIHSIIVSHPHIDHTRLLMDVMRKFKVKNLVDGGGNRGSGIEPLREARLFAKTRGIPYNRITDSKIGPNGYTPFWLDKLRDAGASNVDLRFLSGGGRDCEDQNNNSLTLRVEHLGKKFLFTGDSEDDDEICVGGQIANLVERFDLEDVHTGLLDVDVYKVGHHGSRNGTSEDFMIAMSPAISIMSTGDRNTRSPKKYHAYYFGHPRETAVRVLEEFTTSDRDPTVTRYTMWGVKRYNNDRRITKGIYCTCWDNNIVVEIRANGTFAPVLTNR